MKSTIVPERQTVEDCLKNRTYYVDFYQREYVWSKETVEILLRDIFYSFELSYEQYKNAELTPEIMEKFNWYYLNIFITNNVGGKDYIVDGQQRLSTLTLLATKLYHITDDEYLKDTLKSCIYGRDKWNGNIFMLDHTKRHAVMDCILKKEEYTEPFKNKTEETIIGRYEDISRYIDDKVMNKQKINTFIHYFLERLVLVELTIEKDDTPMIFEVINDRGEALKPFEILKGKMIGALNKIDTETFSDKWDTALARLFNMQDDFFIDYLKSRFIFKRNSKLEQYINQSYHRYIFDNNDIAQRLSFRKNDENQINNIKSFIINDLEYYSKLYSNIRSNSIEYLHFLNSIHNLSGQYQVILSACEVNDPTEDEKIFTIAKEYERLFVLLRMNGVYDSNSFQEISYNLNEAIKGLQIYDYRSLFNDKILSTIKNRKNRVATSVLEFNTFLKADYTNMDTRFLRYFLARIEYYLCSETNQQMQNDVDYISKSTGFKTGYHIEHILSQNDTNKSYFSSEEEFESRRNQLGGLLLLKGLDNISSGNEEYTDKLKTYSVGLVWGHTLCEDFYHTNKDMKTFNDRLFDRCGQKIQGYNIFNKETLEARNDILYNLTKIIWEII